MNIEEMKEILELEKSIKEINEQLNSNNPDCNKLQEITLKAKKKFIRETTDYELGKIFIPNTHIIPVKEMTVNELISRLPFYKSLYLNELKNKYEDEYNKIIQEIE